MQIAIALAKRLCRGELTTEAPKTKRDKLLRKKPAASMKRPAASLEASAEQPTDDRKRAFKKPASETIADTLGTDVADSPEDLCDVCDDQATPDHSDTGEPQTFAGMPSLLEEAFF